MEIVLLNSVDVEDLSLLLDEEREYLLNKYYWDTKYTLNLKKQLLRYRRLDGFAAFDGPLPLGYFYWLLYEKGLNITGFYFSPEHNIKDQISFLDYTAAELSRKFSSLLMEGQLLLVDSEEKKSIFEKYGFQTVERKYMMIELKDYTRFPVYSDRWSLSSLSEYDIYDSRLIDGLSAAMCESYRGTFEEWITQSFGSDEGCRRFITSLIDYPVYGELATNFSFIIRDSAGVIAGMILVARSSPLTGHIVQVSVIPRYQSMGAGGMLLDLALSSMKSTGYQRAILMVTSDNLKAYSLYSKVGFKTLSPFYSINLNKPVFQIEK